MFAQQGLKIALGVKITGVTAGADGVAVAYTDAAGTAQTLACEKLIVSIGRVPNTIGLERRGRRAGARRARLRRRRRRLQDQRSRTSGRSATSCAGPCSRTRREEEGVAVAERIAGQKPHVDFNTVPWVIYTSPEIAWVGQTEQQLKADGRAVPGRHLPVHGQRPGPRHRRHHGHGQDAGRREDRRDPRRAHDRADGVRADRRSRHGDGVQGPRPKTSAASATPTRASAKRPRKRRSRSTSAR